MENLHNMDRLKELENRIKINLSELHNKARIIGNALREIKEQKLYAQNSFKAYCEEVWNRTDSWAYNLINLAEIVEDTFTEDELTPTVGSHITELKRAPKQIRREIWQTAIKRHGDDITAKDIRKTREEIETVNKIKDPAILKLVKNRTITPKHGYELQERLEKLPDKYLEAVARFGIGEDSCITAGALTALRSLDASFSSAADDILRSGMLQDGTRSIPFDELTHSDIRRYHDKLLWEEREQRILEAKEKQKRQVKAEILEGSKIFDYDPESPSLVVYFPEGEFTQEQVAKILTEKRLDTLFIYAYTREEEPDINFNGKKAKPSSVNGVKPMWIMDMIKESTING